LCGIIAAFNEGEVVDITNTSNLAADRALAYEAIERQPETEEIAASNEQETEAKQPGNIGDHVAMYLSQIGSIPIMPQVEANRCIEKVQKGNAAAEQLETLRVIAEESGNAVDPEIKKDLMKAIEAGRWAKDKVVEGNLRLVVSIAKKYINSADSMVFMDLIQEGNIGLMRSIDSFDISRNVKFSTYATFWIRQNITRALATTDPAIRKPIYVAEGRRSVNNAKEQMQQKGLPCDDPLEIAKYMEGDAWDSLSKREQQKKLRIIQHSLQYRKPDSLDAPVNSDAASDSNTPLSEFIPSHNEWDNPEISTSGKALWETMDKILHDMPARDACVLRLRFGLEDGCAYTLKEIGDEMDLTRERVRQVTDKTLDKLRNGKAGKMLQDFLE
jgi:RNA polymerase primary sigma factor